MRAALILLLLCISSCGLRQSRPTAQVCDAATVAEEGKTPTIEDTIRFQIGGKLFYTEFTPSDSVTVIKTTYYPGSGAEETYREYQLIHHHRHSPVHRLFEPQYIDSLYKSYLREDTYRDLYNNDLKPRMDSIRVEYITPEIKDFNGYWIYLYEHEGNYYIEEPWTCHVSFCIADSLYIPSDMEGPFPEKIRKALPRPGGIAIYHGKEETPLEFELFDAKRSIYRLTGNRRPCYVAPAEAIHNFEAMVWLNNTGDLIM